MTVTINGTTGIDKVQDSVVQNATLASGVPSTAKLPAGTVLQVVQGTTTAYTSTTSSTYQSTGITASITPTSASSKILVLVQTTISGKNGNWGDISLFRGATGLYGSQSNTGNYNSGTDGWGTGVINYLDSPNTTSSVSYEVKLRSRNNSGEARSNPDSMLSTITLMEIAA